MTFIAAGLGGLFQSIGNSFNKELDAQKVKVQLDSLSYTGQPLIFIESDGDNLKNLVTVLLTDSKTDFNKSLSPLLSNLLESFIGNKLSESTFYDTTSEAFSDFKLEFNQLMGNILDKVFESSANNPKAIAQRQRFEYKLGSFWSQQEQVLFNAHADKLTPLLSSISNPDPDPIIVNPSLVTNPAALNVNNQVVSSTSSSANPVVVSAQPSFNPDDISDLLSLSSSTLNDTFSKVSIPHAQLREYAVAYGDLIEASLSSDVLKLAVNSVNPGISLDVLTEAIPALELFINKCIEADGIRLNESSSSDQSKLKTLIHSSDVQENLNAVLKTWGLEYDFKEFKLNAKSFTEALVNLDELMRVTNSLETASPKGLSSLNISNSLEFADAVETIVDRKNSSIKNLSLLNYNDDLIELLSGSDFRDLVTDSNRVDLIIELPHSKEAFDLVKNLKESFTNDDSAKLMPEFKFIYPSLENTDIAALRDLIRDRATQQQNTNLPRALEPAFNSYVTKTHEERTRIYELLTTDKSDGGYGLGSASEKAYINLLLDSIAPAKVEALSDIYDEKEYQKKISEAFKLALINGSMNLVAAKNSILAQIHTARRVEATFREEDNLPKIADLLEKSLLAAKPDTDSKKYNSLDYFYWIEQGLEHKELIQNLVNPSKRTDLGVEISEGKAEKLLNAYLDIALTKDEKNKNQKLSKLITDGFSVGLVLEKFKIIDRALGEKYSGYLSENPEYTPATRNPLSLMPIFEDLHKTPLQQLDLFVDKEIQALKSATNNTSPLSEISETTISLYKALRNPSTDLLEKLLSVNLLTLGDENLVKNNQSLDKLIKDFKVLDDSLIPILKTNYPHLNTIIKPLLSETATTWTERNLDLSLEQALNSYKSLTHSSLLENTQKVLITYYENDSLNKPAVNHSLFKTEADRESFIAYLQSFNTASSVLETNTQQLRSMLKEVFLDPKVQGENVFNLSLDQKLQRLGLMEREILNTAHHFIGATQFNLIRPLISTSPSDTESLVTFKDSLKENHDLSSFFSEIRLDAADLVSLGVEPKHASLENLTKYLNYQEPNGLDILKNDMKLRYDTLTEKDNLSHAEAIQAVRSEFTEFLSAYDNSELAGRIKATKNIDFKRLSETTVLSDFSLEAGSLNPTNILNKQRVENFIEANSYVFADGTAMIPLAGPSETQSREYIHLNVDEYKKFRETMSNYLRDALNLNQSNLSRDELILYPSLPKVLDNTGLEMNSAASENSSRILLVNNPELKFQGTSFVQSGQLFLPKALSETTLIQQSDTPSNLVARESISLAKNNFKIYTLNSTDKPNSVDDFTSIPKSATNLNLGGYARDIISELNLRNNREREEQILITETFKSLQADNKQDIAARFLAYETEHGALTEPYKAPVYNNLFLKALEINQTNPSLAVESLTKTFDTLLSKQNGTEQQKNRFLEGIKQIFEVLESVYLDLFANLENESGTKLGKEKITPIMNNPDLNAYFKKHEPAGTLSL